MSSLKDSDILDLGVVALAKAIARGEIKAERAVKASLARIEALDGTLNSFIAVDAEDSLSRARAADRLRAKGGKLPLLHGVPTAHKDMFWQAGKPMTGGSEILLDFKPKTTATTIARLEAAGAIPIGRLNLSEFAASPTGTNKQFGYARNPWDPTRIPGGSSSGSGVAVAGRLVPVSLGSDTGGSIRIPTAINGLVGLKPTHGRVSMQGTMPRAYSLDSVSPMARHAEDVLAVFSVIAGHDPGDPASLRAKPPGPRLPTIDPAKMKLAVLDAVCLGEVAPSVSAMMGRVTGGFKDLGIKQKSARMADLVTLHALGDVISKSEGAALHRRWMTERPNSYARLVYDRTLSGFMIPAVRYIEALSLRAKFAQDFLDNTLGDADAVLLPTVAVETPTIRDVERGEASDDVLRLIASFSRLTRAFNFLGLPALAVPGGIDSNGMPLSFQLVGRPLSEAKLLALAALFERKIGFGLPARPRILEGA